MSIKKMPRNIYEVMRDEMRMRDQILTFIGNETKTIPEISEYLDAPSEEVMYWVMAIRRYGGVREVGRANEDGYFSYEIVPESK